MHDANTCQDLPKQVSCVVQLLLNILPISLVPHRETLRRCLEAMDRALPLEHVLLFGSHVRGEAREDSDVDLCLVAEGAEKQIRAGNLCYSALWGIWPRPGFSLVPITPKRLREKRAVGDFFFASVIKEGIALAAPNEQR